MFQWNGSDAINSTRAVSGIRWEQQRVHIEKLKTLSENAVTLHAKARKKLLKCQQAGSELLPFLRSLSGAAGEGTARSLCRYLHFVVKREDERNVLKLKGAQGSPSRITVICDHIDALMSEVQPAMKPLFDEQRQGWDVPPFIRFETGIQRVVLVM